MSETKRVCPKCGLGYIFPYGAFEFGQCPLCSSIEGTRKATLAMEAAYVLLFAHTDLCPFGHGEDGERIGDCKQRGKPSKECSGKCDCDLFAETYADAISAEQGEL